MKYLLFLGCAAFSATAAVADTGVDPDEASHRDTIVVVATGSELAIDRTGQSITVVTSRELDAIQGADLTRVLERLPGVSFGRTGALGSQTGLFVRGGSSDQLLVLIDGIRIADYASPGGGYDLGHLLMGSIDRVELLRGPNSVIWGSQAMAGVLAVSTREVDGAEIAAEYGAYETMSVNGAAGIVREDHALSFSGGYVDSEGFSARSGGTERDGYRQWQFSGKGRAALGETLTLRAVGRYADSRLDIDQAGPDSPDVQDTREITGRVGLDYAGNGLSLAGGVSHASIRRDSDGAFGPSTFQGRSWRVDARGRADVLADLALDFGAESEWTRAESSFDPRQKARLSSGYAQLGYYGERLSLSAGARFDDHSRFGSHLTLGASGSFSLGEGWRLRAAYGEGFKAPTLYQLFGSFVGNSALEPEESRSYEVGIEKGHRNAPLHLALTAFRRDSRNLIDLDTDFVYQNIDKVRAEGFEVELGASVSPRLRALGVYTYVDARDLARGRALSRRPRHLATVSLEWESPLAGLTLGGDLRMASNSVEYDFAGAATRLESYGLVTVRARLPVSETIEIYGRIENLTDTDYETAAGFNTAGRSAYIGARARF